MTFHNGKGNTSLLLYQAKLELLFYKEISTLLKIPFIGTRSLIRCKTL